MTVPAPPFTFAPEVVATLAPPTPKGPTTKELMDRYRELRTRKDELKSRHQNELAPLTEEMDMIEITLLRVMIESELNSVSSGDSTAYKQSRTSYRVEDPHAFRAWVEAQSRPDFYENRVSKDVLENHLANGGALPPGIAVNSEVVVNIRKK